MGSVSLSGELFLLRGTVPFFVGANPVGGGSVHVGIELFLQVGECFLNM